MMHRRTRAFTLIELLVVIAIILILVAAIVPALNEVWRDADVLKCKSNMKQVGTWFLTQAIEKREYHGVGRMFDGDGSSNRHSPAEWPDIHQTLLSSLNINDKTITACPSSDDSPVKPAWSTCSYVYLGSPAVTFQCKCIECGADDESKDIWRWFWSGVQYHDDHNAYINNSYEAIGHTEGTRHSSTSTAFKGINLRGLPVADNIKWRRPQPVSASDFPTIPIDQGTDSFGDTERTYRENRVLRALPGTPSEHYGNPPLVADIVVFRTTDADDLPVNSDESWSANEMGKYVGDTPIQITEIVERGMLYGNHCLTPASSMKDWGVNVFYSHGNLKWKSWDKMRFQVMHWRRTDVTEYDCYFF